MKLRIAHLYPDLLNLYGDFGNLLCLKRRLQWRDIECTIDAISIGDDYDPKCYDFVFMGGGQDSEQDVLYKDLTEQKKDKLCFAIEDGVVFLCICGGYQLLGQYYKNHAGKEIAGIGALDLYTIAKADRYIGNTMYYSEYLAKRQLDPWLYGFENHSGRTYLGKNLAPLATVQRGFGNNGEDQTEGAIYKQTFCTYAHGSFLPKNPAIADLLLLKALQRKHSSLEELTPLEEPLTSNLRAQLKELSY